MSIGKLHQSAASGVVGPAGRRAARLGGDGLAPPAPQGGAVRSVSDAAMATHRQEVAIGCQTNLTSGIEGPLTTAFLRAIARLALTDKEWAERLGKSAPLWSKQKNGKDGYGLRVQDLDALPAAELGVFIDALLEELARFRGRTLVRRGGQLAFTADALRAVAESLEQIAAVEDERTGSHG